MTAWRTRSQCRGRQEVVLSSRDPPELGRALAIAPWPWQGWDSPERGGRRGGVRLPAHGQEVCGGEDRAMLRGCAGQCCAAACMGLCAELEHPRFASDGKLTAACATP